MLWLLFALGLLDDAEEKHREELRALQARLDQLEHDKRKAAQWDGRWPQ